MKNLSTGVCFLIFMIIAENLFGQNVNGAKLNFPNGKSEWSDTIYKKLRTKQMIKDSVGAVLLAIRYKFVQETETEKRYQIEITNKSPDTKVKFKVRSGRNQEVSTVKLDAGQTKIIQKFYWKAGQKKDASSGKEENEYLFYPLEESLEK